MFKYPSQVLSSRNRPDQRRISGGSFCGISLVALGVIRLQDSNISHTSQPPAIEPAVSPTR